MIGKIAICVCVALTVLCGAARCDEFPDAPRVIDAKWIAWTAATFAATAIDYSVVRHKLNAGECCERGIIGRHSATAGLAVSLGTDVLSTWLSYRWKREEVYDLRAGRKLSVWRWWTPAAVNIAPHAVGITLSLRR